MPREPVAVHLCQRSPPATTPHLFSNPEIRKHLSPNKPRGPLPSPCEVLREALELNGAEAPLSAGAQDLQAPGSSSALISSILLHTSPHLPNWPRAILAREIHLAHWHGHWQTLE